SQIVAMLQSGVKAKRIPTGQAVVYVVLTGPNVASISGFPNSECGNHNANGSLVYAVIPYAWDTRCEAVNGSTFNGSNNDPAAESILSSLAHELSEAATDPIPPT